jgi:hypothetical protein
VGSVTRLVPVFVSVGLGELGLPEPVCVGLVPPEFVPPEFVPPEFVPCECVPCECFVWCEDCVLAGEMGGVTGSGPPPPRARAISMEPASNPSTLSTVASATAAG